MVIHVDLYGDDNKSFKNIENTYPGIQVQKLEYRSHTTKNGKSFT